MKENEIPFHTEVAHQGKTWSENIRNVVWKYAANLQGNTHAEVWFQ